MRWVLAAALLGCDAPPITVAIADAHVSDVAPETGSEAAVCAAVRSPFDASAVCAGNDEDHDCTPDACDDCPNVVQDPRVTGADPATAGDACSYGTEPLRARLFFDAFDVADPRFRDPFPQFFADEKLTWSGGAGHLGHEGRERIAWMEAGAGSRDVLATTIVRVREGSRYAGLALRTATSTPTTAYLCMIESGFLLVLGARVCDASGCAIKVLKDGEKVLRQPLPSGDWGGRVLLRGFARNTMRGVRVDCQAFPAPTSVAEVAGTLRTLDPSKNTLSAELTDPVYRTGEVGLVTSDARLDVESLDVLVGN